MKKRHVCIICGSKRYASRMVKVFQSSENRYNGSVGSSWACKLSIDCSQECHQHPDIKKVKKIIKIISSLEKLTARNYL